MTVVAYFNGEFVDPDARVVPIEERGHQYGDGVYEVLRVYGGRIFLLDWHLERLERSLHAVSIDNPHTRPEWKSLLCGAVRRSGEAEATIYFQVTRGIAQRLHVFPEVRPSVSLIVRPTLPSPSEASHMAICLPDERFANAYVKSINLLPNIIAKEIAHRHGAKEAILLRNGVVTEGSSSNAWFVQGDALYTAPTNRYILGGITRRYVLSLAEQLGLAVHERALTFDELAHVDAVFMTGTTIEILRIHSLMYSQQLTNTYQTLSDNIPDSLLETQEFKIYWQQAQENSVLNRLHECFTQQIQKFRNYEVV